MFKSVRENLNPTFVITLLVIWQFFSVLLMAIGIWPKEVVFLNLGLSVLFLVLATSYQSLLFLIISIPFYVTVPNGRFDTLSTWRLLFFLLFFIWLIKSRVIKKETVQFFVWDKYLGLFASAALLVTVVFASFPLEGIKQLLFWLNIYVLYLVLINVIKTSKQLIEIVKFTAFSLAIIVALGFVQLFATFFTNLDTFWVYWASFVSNLYYGREFMSVALYSNSWFSFTAGRELRMFSILPDSHSFALICVFAMAYLSSLTSLWGQGRAYLWWSAVRFSGLGVILSGTRAVWAGMAAPFLAAVIAYFKNWFRPSIKKAAWSMIFVILFFVLSPLINRGLGYLRVRKFEEHFLARAESIYNLQESSNVSRLFIWRESLYAFLRQPWGVGLGNFLTVVAPASGTNQNFNDLSEQKNERFNLPQKYVTAHSLYLQIAVETGFIGLFAFLAFWYFWGKNVWQFLARHRRDNNFLIFLLIQLVLTFLWLLAAAIFDVTLFNDRVLIYFFLSLGLMAVILKNYENFSKESD